MARPIGMPSSEPHTNPVRMRWRLMATLATSVPSRNSATARAITEPGGGNSADCTRYTAATCQRRNRRSEEHTSELQSRLHLVCRLLLEKKKTRAAQGGHRA